MTTAQNKTLETVKKRLCFNNQEFVSELHIDEYDDGNMHVGIETRLGGCVSKVVEELTACYFTFFISKRGAIYTYTKTYHKRYLSEYDVFLVCKGY